MKIGFVCCPPVQGHFNPMSALARQLQLRNHEVVMFSTPATEPLVRAANLPSVSFGAKEFPVEKMSEIVAFLGRLKGGEALEYTTAALATMTEVQWKQLPDLLVSTGVDALVLDSSNFYGEVIPMRLEMPYAILSNALYFDYSGYTPTCVYGWGHENTPEAIKRNQEGVSKFVQMLKQSNAEVIALAEKAGIKANWEDPSSLFSGRPWITQCPREFDFDSSHWPQNFHHAGPFHDGKGRMEIPFPWEQLTGEPLVYASMGTLQNGNVDVFRTIAAAVSKDKGLQLVLSIGNLLSRDQIGTVPKNAIVVNNAPQLELLKKTSVCITHGGFNTVLEALTQGVPQIAIPVTNDQPGVAARIEYRKTGRTTSLDGLDPLHLSELLDEVLANPVYRDNSRAIQKAIAKKNGLSCAADLLEQAFGVTKTKQKATTCRIGRRENGKSTIEAGVLDISRR
jgi:zeaxanthin glucosyltransferase